MEIITKNNLPILIITIAFVLVFLPFAGKVFLAEVSNVTVYVPATPENQVSENPTTENQTSGAGGSAYQFITNVSTVPPGQKPTPPAVNVKQPQNITETQPTEKSTETAAVSPLPLAVADLSQKIPEFGDILSNLNINNAADVANLQNYNIFLPGIKEITGALEAEGLSLFSSLTQEQKNKIPSETSFVLLGNGNIDALTQLDFSNSNSVGQKVNVFTGEPMRLVVKPKAGAKSVLGYILFETPASAVAFTGRYIPSFNMALSALTGSNSGISYNYVPPSNIVQTGASLQSDQQFKVLSFSYNNINNDGIYVADINAPTVQGEYEIVTSIDYGGAAENEKDIKMTTLVDPEGYIYEKTGDKELRINNATVSLYELNTQSGSSKNQYELWNANEFGQENPQITDATGDYSFLVPAGTYYLTVAAPGYYFFQSDAFSVAEGKEIRANIALKKEFDLSSVLNWDTILIIILFCLVIYNFYRDWKRKSQ